MIQTISPFDFLLSFIYTIALLFLINLFKPKKRPHDVYFVRFFIVKILFAIIFVLIHSYYYKGGDTFLYFAGGKFFSNQILNAPSNTFNLLFSPYESFSNIVYGQDYGIINYIRSDDIFYMSKFLSIFCLLGFNQFLASNIIFTVFTAIGVWKLYETLCLLYPTIYKYFAIGILFYPTIAIWGSGILKDPLTLATIGIIFKCTYNLINNKKLIYSIIGILLSTFVCFVLKPYILYIFIPCILLWVQGKVSQKAKSRLVQSIITIFLIGIFSAGGYFLLNTISSGAGKYSLDNVQSVAEGFNDWHRYLAETRNQSGYSLGEIEYTVSGIVEKIPQSFFVSYYRPFIIGDVRNAATLFEAIQCFILLIITVIIFYRVGLIRFLRITVTDSNVRAFMLFAISFGVTVGLTSYNFGALSRYKIPSLPFFTASLAIIYYIGYKQNIYRRKT